ncbi:flagellar hook-length control protein FliK [Desulfotruncus alcoholivorax]|uniref:flagellar hook-length control protein FliK n=1 Tax=Desulfotruncus alcoholivorax TaxID=265477 RepID=UPI000419D78B|nr:flagellar hook-length control protein FliK [Desulfotruncus alcoholivorax]
MQISGVIPVLLNIILSEQQNPKHGQLPRELIAAKETAKAAEVLTKGTEQEAPAQPHARGHEGSEPLLLPLPFKTPLYPETQFYVFRKRGRQKKEQDAAAGEPGVVFSLSTNSLGSLFFYLTAKENTVNIACHTENEKFAAQLASHSGDLREQIQKTGFKQVIFRCTVLDPQMKNLMTGLANPVILDQKV